MPQHDLPVIELPLSRRTANRLGWAAFALTITSVVANGVSSLGFLPMPVIQVSSAVAAAATTIGYLCARVAPSSRAQAAMAKAAPDSGSVPVNGGLHK